MSAFSDLLGVELGPTDWLDVSQGRIERFAAATEDSQWIHVDADRAAQGPFGTTIAHGYLTLSLASLLLSEVLAVSDAGMTINYGLDRVRFPAPVPVGSKVRAGVQCRSVDDITGGVQVGLTVTFEVEGQSKPPCVAEILFRYYS